jgi:hypothetical protein
LGNVVSGDNGRALREIVDPLLTMNVRRGAERVACGEDSVGGHRQIILDADIRA